MMDNKTVGELRGQMGAQQAEAQVAMGVLGKFIVTGEARSHNYWP